MPYFLVNLMASTFDMSMKIVFRVLICFALILCPFRTVLADEIGVPTEGLMGVTLTLKEIIDAQRLQSLGLPRQTYPPPIKDKTAAREKFPLPTTAQAEQVLPSSVVTPAAVSLGLQFTTNTGSLADTSAAVGPSQYIVTVNNRIRSFNKVTGVADGALNIYTGDFFRSQITPTVSPSYAFITDPRVRYDRLSRRWFIMMIDVPVAVNASGGTAYSANRIMIAVSSGPVITAQSSFTFFQFQADLIGPTPNKDTGTLADYPTLGIDANALYIGVNTYAQENGIGPSIFVIRKSSVVGAGPIVVTAFRDVVAWTPQGVDNYDPNATEGYFISAYFKNALRVTRISTPGATPTLTTADVPIPDYAGNYKVPHLGSTRGDLDIAGDRLYAAHVRNGRLWIVHNVLVDATGASSTAGDRGASRWYEIKDISTATPTLAQSGTLFDTAATSPKWHYLPSIIVSGQGHAVVGLNTSGKADYINAAVTQRFASDPAGSMQVPTAYTASSTAYKNDANRWGDYVDAAIDPEDNMTAWVVHIFADLDGFANLRIAQVKAPAPPPNLTAVPNSIAPGQASVNVVITGSGITAAAGQGFYDPGAGFAKRLAADIPGGVTVNSVTYTSPTQITLNVSTVGTPPGNKNVTVTNPDGQSVTGPFVINVTATPLTPQSITFPAVAAFSWYQGSATLAATASSSLAVAYSVVSGPCRIAANLLTATHPGSCLIASNQAGNTTTSAAAQQTQMVTITAGPMLLDIDASNTGTRYSAATDGVMILRYLAGFTGTALTLNSTGSSASRNTAQIATHLASLRPLMDVDGDGAALASTDGVLIVRYMIGLRGSTLVQGVKLSSTAVAQVEANIASLMP
jgi:hypothetical protein